MANPSENPFRPSTHGRPRVPARPPTPEERDKQRREKQLKLGVLWSDRRITKERLQERRVGFTAADIERYQLVTKEMRAMKGTEEPGWTEWMLLEGADGQGGVTGSKYEWFGGDVLAYNPNKIDDVLHRTDAILFFLEEENDRRAYPVSVDTVSFEDRYSEKFRKDFARLNPRVVQLSSAYWVDTESDTAGEAIDVPREGVIQTVPTSVYIPSSFAEKYRDPSTSIQEADALMRRLRPFVLEQMRVEMETQLLYLLGELRFKSMLSGEATSNGQTRSELMEQVKHMTLPEGRRGVAVNILSNALTTIWRESEAAGPMDAQLRRELPGIIQKLGAILPQEGRYRQAV